MGVPVESDDLNLVTGPVGVVVDAAALLSVVGPQVGPNCMTDIQFIVTVIRVFGSDRVDA